MSDPKQKPEPADQSIATNEQIKNREAALENTRQQNCGDRVDEDELDVSGTFSTGPKAKLEDE